jgi:tetrahydromethanopterin S-methyltransferase subunit A
MVIDLEGKAGEAGEDSGDGFAIEGIPTVSEPDLEYVKKLNESLDYKVGLITRDLGLASGVQSESLTGLLYGTIFALVFVAIPLILKIGL